MVFQGFSMLIFFFICKFINFQNMNRICMYRIFQILFIAIDKYIYIYIFDVITELGVVIMKHLYMWLILLVRLSHLFIYFQSYGVRCVLCGINKLSFSYFFCHYLFLSLFIFTQLYTQVLLHQFSNTVTAKMRSLLYQRYHLFFVFVFFFFENLLKTFDLFLSGI